MQRKLVLFDIDGTILVGSNRVHNLAFLEAIHKVYGLSLTYNELAGKAPGKTDKQIIFEFLLEKGLSHDEINSRIDKALETMGKYFKKNVVASELKLQPGVRELLKKLKSHNHILGLLTGNVEVIGRVKMEKVGLSQFFEVGAFGDISIVRADLVPKAIEEAERKFKTKFDKKDVFVVGDAPGDIQCGKANSIKTIAVATGKIPIFELSKHKHDYLFENFKNIDEAVKAIESE